MRRLRAALIGAKAHLAAVAAIVHKRPPGASNPG
jgi:hypothetical protein